MLEVRYPPAVSCYMALIIIFSGGPLNEKSLENHFIHKLSFVPKLLG